MDFGGLGERQGPAFAAMLGLLAEAGRPLRRDGVIDVGVEASGVAAKTAENLLYELAAFGAVRLGGRGRAKTAALTTLGGRWLESDEGARLLRSGVLADGVLSSRSVSR